MSDPVLFSLAAASADLAEVRRSEKRPFTVQHTRGTMVLELYGPRGVDDQQPHTQDELYFVVRGSGTFVCGEERVDFQTGDALFAAAGVEHRFVDFTDDFETWVVFYGREGGEIPHG
jgi:mannose-6-phosphate isomerase-like protein (cupin superfamily)